MDSSLAIHVRGDSFPYQLLSDGGLPAPKSKSGWCYHAEERMSSVHNGG